MKIKFNEFEFIGNVSEFKEVWSYLFAETTKVTRLESNSASVEEQPEGLMEPYFRTPRRAAYKGAVLVLRNAKNENGIKVLRPFAMFKNIATTAKYFEFKGSQKVSNALAKEGSVRYEGNKYYIRKADSVKAAEDTDMDKWGYGIAIQSISDGENVYFFE